MMAQQAADAAQPQPTTLLHLQPLNQLITVKLNDTNFLVWKQQILATVRGYGLEGFLDGTKKQPSEHLPAATADQLPVINPEHNAWMRQDQMLVSWPLSSLTESVLVQTVGLSSSNEIWESLENTFATQSRAKIMQYKFQLQAMKKGSPSMREYLNKIKTCCDLLRSAGQTMNDDDDEFLHIISGLGAEYNPVMVSINSRAEPHTIREVHSLLLGFENRLEGAEAMQFSSEGSVPSANLATQGRGRGYNYSRGRGRAPNQSFNGNQQGRGGRSAFRGNTQQRGRCRSNGKTPCYWCGYTNHTSDKCYYRDEACYPQKAQQGGTNGPSANMASFGQGDNYQENAWFPDSGATNHLTYDFGNLNTSTDYQGEEKVQMGNGSGSHHKGNTTTREC